MATMDHVNLAELWNESVTNERMPIRNGAIDVPEGPGLGVTVNIEKLRHLAQAPRPQYKPFLVKIMYQNGPTIIARHNPDVGSHVGFLKRLLGNRIPGPTPGYINHVRTEWWDDVDEPAFQKAWKETENREYILQ